MGNCLVTLIYIGAFKRDCRKQACDELTREREQRQKNHFETIESYKNNSECITSLKNLPSPAPSESLPHWFQGNFAAMFVSECFEWLREFPLSVFADRFDLRCEPKQLILLYYKICPCSSLQKKQHYSSQFYSPKRITRTKTCRSHCCEAEKSENFNRDFGSVSVLKEVPL